MADAKAPRPRKAVGPERPKYFDSSDIDRVMAVLLALVSEVAAMRERIDTHERLCEQGELPTAGAVDAYRPDDAVEESREIWRDAFIKRIFRVITEDIESLRNSAAPRD
jgi:hypothetical protein